MGYLNKKIITEAYEENNFLGGIIAILDRIGVIGTELKKSADHVVDFLTRKNISHDSNGEFLVWVDDGISEDLKILFKKKL